MAEESFELEIVTPAGVALTDRATQVTLPTQDGEIGVLPLHTKYTGLLATGLLEYYSPKKGEPVRLVISGGFCSFSNGKLRILADRVDLLSTVDREGYAKDRSALMEKLKEGNTQDPEWIRSKEQLDRIECVDRLISH